MSVLRYWDVASSSWKPVGSVVGGEVDTGWVNVTVEAGFTPMSGSELPQVRRIGNRVQMRGGWTNAGMAVNSTHNVGALPLGFNPASNYVTSIGTSAGQYSAIMFATSANPGVIQLRTGPSLSSYYKCDSTWLVD